MKKTALAAALCVFAANAQAGSPEPAPIEAPIMEAPMIVEQTYESASDPIPWLPLLMIAVATAAAVTR